MVKRFYFGICLAVLAGCAGGPTHDYYNPRVHGAKFKGPATVKQVTDITNEVARLMVEGYTLIGQTDYTGKHPEAVELTAQARRAGANHVVYSSRYVPPTPDQPGSWHFSFGRGFGSGGTGSGEGGFNDVHIAFLGKPGTDRK